MTQYNPTIRRPIELDYATDDKAVFNFLNAVYAYMCCGLAVTGLVAWYVGTQQADLVRSLHTSGGAVVLLLISFACVWGIQYAAPRVNPNVGLALFLLYSTFIGVILSGVFVVYKLGSIGQVFAITSGTFAGMSLYGYTTKRDLSGIGSILVMAFWGLLLASVVNLFFASGTLYWIVSYAGVAIFIGLTAYETQKLKEMAYRVQNDGVMASRLAVIGALTLYLTFVNLFIFMLRVFGGRK